MTGAPGSAGAAAVPLARLWGIGRYDLGDEPVYFEISWDDWRRDTAWARDMLASHGISRDSGLVIVGGMAESPWFDPFETAARELGVPYSIGDVYPFEAFRTSLYARRLPITMIFGIDQTVAEALGTELAGIVARIPVIGARPDAAALLAGAGAQPFTVTRVGPAIAVECPHRAGAHLNGAEWTLTEHGSELLISTEGPRAHQVSHAPVGLRGVLASGPCACGRTGQRVTVTA